MQCDQCENAITLMISQKYKKLKYDRLPWLCQTCIKEMQFSSYRTKIFQDVLFQINHN